jgi:hypothetical protein
MGFRGVLARGDTGRRRLGEIGTNALPLVLSLIEEEPVRPWLAGSPEAAAVAASDGDAESSGAPAVLGSL